MWSGYGYGVVTMTSFIRGSLTNCWYKGCIECIFWESEEDTCFPHSGVPDEQKLEQIVVCLGHDWSQVCRCWLLELFELRYTLECWNWWNIWVTWSLNEYLAQHHEKLGFWKKNVDLAILSMHLSRIHLKLSNFSQSSFSLMSNHH